MPLSDGHGGSNSISGLRPRPDAIVDLGHSCDRVLNRLPGGPILGAMNCPDCDAPTKEHKSSYAGQTFECAAHGLFGVSPTAMAMGFEREDAWVKSSALSRAIRSMRACDHFPIITSYHL